MPTIDTDVKYILIFIACHIFHVPVYVISQRSIVTTGLVMFKF